jgi:hypothetical protein
VEHRYEGLSLPNITKNCLLAYGTKDSWNFVSELVGLVALPTWSPW